MLVNVSSFYIVLGPSQIAGAKYYFFLKLAISLKLILHKIQNKSPASENGWFVDYQLERERRKYHSFLGTLSEHSVVSQLVTERLEYPPLLRPVG